MEMEPLEVKVAFPVAVPLLMSVIEPEEALKE
jgi:hypothetical protein